MARAEAESGIEQTGTRARVSGCYATACFHGPECTHIMPVQWSIADFYIGSTIGEGRYGRVVHAIVKDKNERNDETSPTRRRPRISSGSACGTSGEDTQHCRHVAIKILDKSQLIRLKQTKAALRERKILTYLTEIGQYGEHTFVPRLLMSFVDESSLYIVTELCDGGTLADFVRHINNPDRSQNSGESEQQQLRSPFNCNAEDERNQWVRHILAQLLCGLEFLHSHGIIHRDVKPENSLLLSNGCVKLVDFGSAIHVQSDIGEGEVDGIDEFVGTADFVSPEMLRGARDSTDASAFISFHNLAAQDLWSFGCMVHFSFSGRSPFHSESDHLAMKAILSHADGRHVCTLSDRVPPNGKGLINALLAGKPEMRLGYGDIVWRHPRADDEGGKSCGKANETENSSNFQPTQHYTSIRQHGFFLDTNWDSINRGTATLSRTPPAPAWVKQYEAGSSDLRDGASIHNDLSWLE